MPRGDRTGPMGFGPMTGRAAGYCAGFGVPGFMNQSGGRSWGRGAWGSGSWGGGGRGWRHWFYATGLPGWMRFGGGMYPYPTAPVGTVAPAVPDEEAELEALKEQAEYFERNLEGLRRRIQKLEGMPKTE
jgi:Family of unknown function (DUF5320)